MFKQRMATAYAARRLLVGRRLWLASLLSALLCFASPLSAAVFKVRRITIEGLHGINQQVVYKHLGVHVGDLFDTDNSAAVIRSLYDSGFFSNVSLARQGNTLVVRVNTRQVIAYMKIAGNKAIKSKQLKKVLHENGIALGRPYNPQVLDAIISALKQQYINMGYSKVTIHVRVKERKSSRAALYIDINEGKTTKYQKISILGSRAFSERRLRKAFHASTPGLFTFFSHADVYSPARLDEDLIALNNFYLNHGYLQYKVLSKKLIFTPDHRKVSLMLRIHEGPQYRLASYRLQGNPLGQRAAVSALLQRNLKPGSVFSRADIIALNRQVSLLFADKGYAFVKVDVEPQLNNVQRTVALVYSVKPGARVYVRRIQFFGNTHTNQDVLRAQVTQYEGGAYNQSQVDESARRLNNVPYIQNVTSGMKAVPGQPSLVDLNYHLKERNAGSASLNGGYSDVDGFVWGGKISEPNFLGTGHLVSLGFSRSRYQKSYNFQYYNPFYRPDGIGRGLNLSYTHQTPGNVNITSYELNTFDGKFFYTLPVSAHMRLMLGLGYNHFALSSLDPTQTAAEVINFTQRYGSTYHEAVLSTALNYSTTDRYIYPTSGTNSSLTGSFDVPLTQKSLTFYAVGYNADWYHPLNHARSWVWNLHTQLGYGGGVGGTPEYPFYKNYYAGGIGSVPGFEGNSLGPQDKFGNALGGNVLATLGSNLFFPNPFSERLRLGLSVDAGNVFQDHITTHGFYGPRYSAGLLVKVLLPIFPQPITFSIAEPLNAYKATAGHPADHKQIFGFSMGGSVF